MKILQTAEQKSRLRRFLSYVVRRFKSHRWITVAFVLVLAALPLVGGAQGVLTQFQQWLGYVPRVGFVQLEEARTLLAPVEVTQDEVTRHVSEVVAQLEQTVVALPPVTDQLLTELYPEPYSPTSVSDTRNGVTVRLLSVVHAPEETLLELQGEWTEADWEYFYFDHGPFMSLQDDLGHLYHERAPSNSDSESLVVVSVEKDTKGSTEGERYFRQKETKAFSPVSLAAQHFSLDLPHVVYELPVSAEFELDLGDKPQIGDDWPLDIRLEVAKVPIHIRGVRLKEQIASDMDPRQQNMYQLLFDVTPFPAEATRSLQSIHLRSHVASNGGGSSYSSMARQVEPELSFAKIPSGQLQVKVEYATVMLHGPWQLEWSVPDISAAEGGKPVSLQPDCHIQRHNGVALCLFKVTLTDRLTSVKVRAEEIPADRSFDVYSYGQEAYLTDDRGNRYDYLSGYTWQSDTPLDEQLPPFAPLSTLATNATLHLPEVRLNLYDSYRFEVTVPEEVPLHTNKVGIESSDTWSISIPAHLANYDLEFTEAQIIQNGSTMMLSLTSEPFVVEEGTYAPKYIHLGTITTPNGQTRKIDGLSTPRIGEGGYIRQQEDGTFSASLFFDIGDPLSKSIITGRYELNLSGITVAVPGAWELSFPVRGP